MRSLRALAAGGAIALVLGGCGGGSDEPGAGNTALANGKTFTMVIPGDPGNLDPHLTSLSVTGQVDRFLYDSLLRLDAAGTLGPSLATAWKASLTKATFTLRSGVTCADGTPMTAALVAQNINFVGDPKNGSTRIGVYVPAGAKATADDATGVVTVTAPAPDAFLDRNLGSLPIVCANGLKNRDLLKAGADGTGMFTVKESVAGDHLTLARRPGYAWGPGDWKVDQPGVPETVVFKIVTSETTAANLVLSGAVNVARLLGPDGQRLTGSGISKQDFATPAGPIWFNEKTGLPTADEAVRRAIVQALDLGQLGQVLTSGTGTKATGVQTPSISPCKQNTIGSSLPGHDPAAAGAALDAAGWTKGADGTRSKDGRPLKLAFAFVSGSTAGVQAAAELLQQQWKGVGVGVTLKPVTAAQIGQIAGGQTAWDVALIPIGITLPSQLVPYVSGATPPNGANFAAIKNADYTSNVKAAAAVPGADGCDKWAAAEAALFAHLDLLPIVNTSLPTFAKGATVRLSDGDVDPTSIRMLANG